MNIGKLGKSSKTGEQTSDFSGDGRDGVTTTMLASWGHAYRAASGALVCTLPIDGNDGNGFAIAPQTPTGVPDLAEGESAVGNFAAGCFLHFKNDGTASITATRVEHNGINIGDTHNHPQNDGDHYGGGVNTSAPNT